MNEQKWWQLPKGPERERLKAETELTLTVVEPIGPVPEFVSQSGRHYFKSPVDDVLHSFDSRSEAERRGAMILATGGLHPKHRYHHFAVDTNGRLQLNDSRTGLTASLTRDTVDEFKIVAARIGSKRQNEMKGQNAQDKS